MLGRMYRSLRQPYRATAAAPEEKPNEAITKHLRALGFVSGVTLISEPPELSLVDEQPPLVVSGFFLTYKKDENTFDLTFEKQDNTFSAIVENTTFELLQAKQQPQTNKSFRFEKDANGGRKIIALFDYVNFRKP